MSQAILEECHDTRHFRRMCHFKRMSWHKPFCVFHRTVVHLLYATIYCEWPPDLYDTYNLLYATICCEWPRDLCHLLYATICCEWLRDLYDTYKSRGVSKATIIHLPGAFWSLADDNTEFAVGNGALALSLILYLFHGDLPLSLILCLFQVAPDIVGPD